jgi:hypothetical protein
MMHTLLVYAAYFIFSLLRWSCCLFLVILYTYPYDQLAGTPSNGMEWTAIESLISTSTLTFFDALSSSCAIHVVSVDLTFESSHFYIFHPVPDHLPSLLHIMAYFIYSFGNEIYGHRQSL